MAALLAFATWHYWFSIPLMLSSLFLILLVLVQRGRGGGLIGALGGRGGHSVFGPRAGDTFTWLTFVAAIVWIAVAVAAICFLAR